MYVFMLVGAKLVNSAVVYSYSTEVLLMGLAMAGGSYLLTEPLVTLLVEDFGNVAVYRYYYLWLMLYAVPVGVYVFDIGYLTYHYAAIGISTAFITLGIWGISNL
jgi:hypothetical protein